MKPVLKYCIAGFILLFNLSLCSGLFAQTEAQDTLYLKDGSILTGYIVNPAGNGTIRIRNNGGLVMYVAAEKISKMAVHATRIEKQGTSESRPPQLAEERIAFGLRAGAALPFSYFSAIAGSNAGFAKPGWTAEADIWIRISPQLYWNTKVAHTSNPFKIKAFAREFEDYYNVTVTNSFAGKWLGWHFLTGLSSTRVIDERFSYFFQEIWIFKISKPAININAVDATNYYISSRQSSSGAGISVSFAAGLRFLEKYTISISLIKARIQFLVIHPTRAHHSSSRLKCLI
ncbi:MAG: hypothetical protein R2850_10415 [Bacteroidia bacterium]